MRRYGILSAAAVAFLALLAVLRINPLSLLVNGLQVGSVYALVGLGIALVYKATRVLNFAQGELGTVPAFVVFLLLAGSPTAEVGQVSAGRMLGATVAAVAVGAVLAILVNLLVVQRLANATPVTSLVATAGVMLLLISIQFVTFGANAKRFPRFIDGAPCLSSQAGECVKELTLGGVPVQWQTIIVLLVLGVASVLLALFFRTPVGIALLAASQEPFAAELHGISTRMMSTVAWGAAGAFAVLGGVLGAGEFQQVMPAFMTSTFLVPAFTGAVLGGITSMAGAVLGGLLLGFAAVFANTVVVSYGLTGTIPGPPVAMTFLVLLLTLLVRPRGLLGKEA